MPGNDTGAPERDAGTDTNTVDSGTTQDSATPALRVPGAADVTLTKAGASLESRILREGRNEGPALLFDAWYSKSISLDDMRVLLPDVWQMAEYPTRNLPADIWVEWFRMVGWTATDDRLPPIETVQLYRGSTWGRRRGMSWTPAPTVARWFADRFLDTQGGGPAHVFQCQVPADAVLSFVEERKGEPEFVVDPGGLPPLGRLSIIAAAGVAS